MSTSIHPKFDGIVQALDLLHDGASAIYEAAAARRKRARTTPQRRGQALHAGANTPLWNTLATAVGLKCKNHGDQAKLARFLGLPRQRVNAFMNGIGPIPDAERTLMLLQWLAEQPAAEIKTSRK